MGRPRSPETKESVHLRTPSYVLARVDEIARNRGVPRTTVMLDAIRRQLEIEPPRRRNVFDEETLGA